MAFNAKTVNRRGLVANRNQFVALEFQQFSTACAIQVVVLGIAVIVVVHGSAIQLETIQQSGIDALPKGSIDRRGADIVGLTTPWQPFDQFFGIKVIMLAEHLVDQELSLAGLS